MPRTAWGRFWFQPTDPTVLGFMRIVTGLVALYVHLAYCFDLSTFFGPNAFLDQPSALQTRYEQPMFTVSMTDWQGRQPMLVMPQLPDRRVAAFDFLRGLPETRRERDELLSYLYSLLENYGSGDGDANRTLTYNGLVLLKDAGKLEPEQRQRMLDVLSKKEYVAQEVPLTLPIFFFHQNVTQEERVRLWQGALRLSDFLWELPSLYDEDYRIVERRISYILFWMFEMYPSQRGDLANYLRNLPEGEEGRKIIEYFANWRADPREVYAQGTSNFSIWYHLTNPSAMWLAHVIVLIIFLLFTLGIFTRVTSVLAWLAALQYIHRSQQILFGMDTMMNILLIYLMVAPSGAALSIDRLIARYRAARAIYRSGGKPVPWAEAVLAGPQASSLANFALRLFQIHFCIMYTSAGLSKLKGTMWWNTEATWYTIANPEFTPMNYWLYEETLRKLASFKPLMLIIWGTFTYFTLFMEICFPFLVWTRLRPFVVSLAILLHAGIAIVMGLTCFQLFMLTLLLCYLPASVIRGRLLWEPGSGSKMTLRYDSRDPSQMRLVSFIRAFDLTGQITVRDEPARANSHDGAELVGVDGQVYSGYRAIDHASANLQFARTIRWLLVVPGVAWLISYFTSASANGTA